MKTTVMNETSVKHFVVAEDLMLVNSQASLLLAISYHPIRQPEPKLVQSPTKIHLTPCGSKPSIFSPNMG